jgi:hypothetical protein
LGVGVVGDEAVEASFISIICCRLQIRLQNSDLRIPAVVPGFLEGR